MKLLSYKYLLERLIVIFKYLLFDRYRTFDVIRTIQSNAINQIKNEIKKILKGIRAYENPGIRAA